MTEAVIIDAIQTPIGALGGVLASVRPDDLAALVIKETFQRNKLDPILVEEVFLGCANQAGKDNRNMARMAALLAGAAFGQLQNEEVAHLERRLPPACEGREKCKSVPMTQLCRYDRESGPKCDP